MADEDAKKDSTTKKCGYCIDIVPCLPARYALAVISLFGLVNVYTLRIDLSMAIVTMVGTHSHYANSTTALEFDWTSTQQGWILASFFIGYVMTQIPGGYLATRFGARYVLGIAVLMTSILTLLTPFAAKIHIGVLILLRVLEGMFEGVSFPSMHALWGKWAPPKERSILTSITYAGPYLGDIIAFLLSAVLCEYGFAGGWPSVFYVFGIAGIVWFFFWLFLGFDSPATHPRISESEKLYIETSIAEDEETKDKMEKVPWLRMLTSPAVWGIVVAHFCNNWGTYTLLTCIPSFFKDILRPSHGRNLIKNGIFSSIPFVAFVIVALLSGQIADLLRKTCLPTVIVRKLFTTAGMFSAAAGLIIAGYLDADIVNSVIFITISVGLNGMINAGFFINHIDIAPQYAGVLMSFSNTAAGIPGIVGPIVAKAITKKPNLHQNQALIYQKEWREVFLLSAEIYIFGALVYLILGRGERQPWAGGEEKKDGKDAKKLEKKTGDEVKMKLLAKQSHEE